jgi:hypothetical protein
MQKLEAAVTVMVVIAMVAVLGTVFNLLDVAQMVGVR